MPTAPTSSTPFDAADEGLENRAAEAQVSLGAGLVVSTQYLGARVSHPVVTTIL